MELKDTAVIDSFSQEQSQVEEELDENGDIKFNEDIVKIQS